MSSVKTESPRLWGKLRRTKEGGVDSWLPLAEHCIDVASAFLAACNTQGVQRALAHALGNRPTAVQLERLATLAFLHDIGKCNHGFQAKARSDATDTAGHVRELSALFCEPDLHAAFLKNIAYTELASWFEGDETALRMLLASISHHGKPIEIDQENAHRFRRFWSPREGVDPLADLASLLNVARHAFPHAFSESAPRIPDNAGLQHRFAGLVMLADWLGSHQGFFPFHHGPGPRLAFAQRAAAKAVASIGLEVDRSRRNLRPRADFADLFPGFQATPLQAALMNPPDVPVLIAESDTGSGKTEAALACFFRLFARGEIDSLYFALPTRVAARELYDRVREFAAQMFGEDAPPVLLAVPGYAKVDGERFLPSQDNLWHDEADLRRRERAWAAERPKRFLAAPVAVGTIDQALLATMQVNHAHLRAVCLERSLLVVDEVHASDVYMRGLLRALLEHHTAAGGRALLLSATLGADAKEELLAPAATAPHSPSFERGVKAPYPALSGTGMPTVSLADRSGRRKSVQLEATPNLSDPTGLLSRLAESLRSGARVLVVLNTVDRAITFLRAAESHPHISAFVFRINGQACPHHGRFARVDRLLLDAEVSRVLGKGTPGGPLLLVGTQTLEQSLDIDADWLITDLCPMDVLLQRIGRLHRHDRLRPTGFETATCTVLTPEEKSLEHWFDTKGRARGIAGLGTVYPDLRIAQLTLDRIVSGCTIEIPADNRLLVEATMHPERLAQFGGHPWDAHRNDLLGIATAQGLAARGALLPWEVPFGPELRFRSFDERLTTRLGLEDRRVPLDPPLTSAFGQTLHEIPIPGWLAGETEASVPDAPPENHEGVVALRYGGRAYRYSRFGLELDR